MVDLTTLSDEQLDQMVNQKLKSQRMPSNAPLGDYRQTIKKDMFAMKSDEEIDEMVSQKLRSQMPDRTINVNDPNIQKLADELGKKESLSEISTPEAILAGYGKQATFGNLPEIQAIAEDIVTPKPYDKTKPIYDPVQQEMAALEGIRTMGGGESRTPDISKMTASDIVNLSKTHSAPEIEQMLVDAGFTKPQTFKETVRENEQTAKKIQQQKPLAYGLGEVAGVASQMGLTTPLAPVRGANFTKRAIQQGVIGSGFGLAMKPEDGGSRTMQAVLGGIIGPTFEGVIQSPKLARWAFTKLPQTTRQKLIDFSKKTAAFPRRVGQKSLSVLFGVKPDIIDKYVDGFERINQSIDKEDLLVNLDTVVQTLKNDVDNGKIGIKDAKLALQGLKSEVKSDIKSANRILDDAFSETKRQLKTDASLADISDDIYDSVGDLKRRVISGSQAATELLDGASTIPRGEVFANKRKKAIDFEKKLFKVSDYRTELDKLKNEKIKRNTGIRLVDEKYDPNMGLSNKEIDNKIKVVEKKLNDAKKQLPPKITHGSKSSENNIVGIPGKSAGGNDIIIGSDGALYTIGENTKLADDIANSGGIQGYDVIIFDQKGGNVISARTKFDQQTVKTQEVKDVIKMINEDIGTRTKSGKRVLFSDEDVQAVANIQKYADRLNQFGDELTYPELKGIVKSLDRDITTLVNQNDFQNAKDGAAAKLRKEISELLKDSVPEYRKAMIDVADNASLLSDINKFAKTPERLRSTMSRINSPLSKDKKAAIQKLGQKLNVDYDTALEKSSKIQKMLKSPKELRTFKEGMKEARALSEIRKTGSHKLTVAENKIKIADEKLKDALESYNSIKVLNDAPNRTITSIRNKNKKALQAISKIKEEDFVQMVDDAYILDQFTKHAERGSKNVNLFAMIGLGVGAISGGGINPTTMAVGGAIGATVDKFGPQITKRIIDNIVRLNKYTTKPTIAMIRKMNIPKNAQNWLIDQLPKGITATQRGK